MLNWRDPVNPLAGGAERVSLGYLKALRARGHEVFWFANSFDGAAAEEVVEGIRVVRGGCRFTSQLLASRWCRTQPAFDLVIDQHHGLPWFAPWWCQARCVAFIHEVLGPIWNSFYSWPLSAVGQWQEWATHWLYRSVPFWTASSDTAKLLRERGVTDITQIPYGVDTRALPELDSKALVQPLRLVTVSRLAPNKRVDHAIRTVRFLLDEGVDVHLTVIGEGEMELDWRGLSIELGVHTHVAFTGQISEKEKDDHLRLAHFLLHTSVREGWGLNVIEANALGTPAAVYPVAGLVESTLAGVTGIVSEKETPRALAAALLRALSEPEIYQEYRRAAWKRAEQFHWDNVLPKACDWLESVAAGRHRAVR